MKNKEQQSFKEKIAEVFKDLDLNDSEFLQPENNIGGLYLCVKCCCVHRPGPCMDIGISIEEFKNMKEKKIIYLLFFNRGSSDVRLFFI